MRTWRLGSIAGTDIHLNPTLLIFGVYAFVTGHGLLFMLSTLSILLHECAHAIACMLVDSPPEYLELTPMGAVLKAGSFSSVSPMKKMCIIGAGPLLTFLLAACALALAGSEIIPMNWCRTLFVCNIAFLIVNLLPVLPLDGGRMLHLIMHRFFQEITVNFIMRFLGIIVGIALIVLNIWFSVHHGGWNLTLSFAGCIIWYMAYRETTSNALLELRYLLDRKILLERKQRMKTIRYTVPSTITVRKLMSMLPCHAFVEFACIEIGTQRCIGQIHECELIQHYLCNPTCRLVECFKKECRPNECKSL